MALALLAGCTVGPDYVAPTPDLPPQWSASSTATVDSRWWQQMGDPQLTSLVERAARANLDIRTASNRLEQSRIARQVSGSATLPGIAGNGDYQRERRSEVGLNDPSGNAGQAPFEQWQGALDLSWEIDLWGHIRRRIEMADAQVELSQAQRDAVILSISAQTATDYLRLRGVQQQLRVLAQNLHIAEQSRGLTQTRFDNGVTTDLDTANAAALVATLQARAAPLQAQRDRLINALSYLLGLAPHALAEELGSARALPQLAPELALGIPSQLAQRRPDIQQSEARLHQAIAAIGAAEADFYPRVTLGASAGFQALEGGDIGAWNSRQWSYGPSLYLPIFQGGRLTGTLALRRQEQQAAALDYQKTVLGAWHEVDDAMTGYAAEQRHHAALSEAVLHNQRALDTARERYRQGAIDFLNVLAVQRSLLDTQSALVDSAADLAIDRVQLYRALAGGWPQA